MSADDRKAPPNDERAERAILGGVLHKPAAAFDVIETMDAEDFFMPAHREIYAVLCELITTGSAIDVVTVANRLHERGTFALEGGAHGYCLRIYDEQSVLDAENIGHWVDIVRDKSHKRRVMAVSADFHARAAGDDVQADHLLAEFQAQVFAINAQRGPQQFIANDVTNVLATVERRGLDPREIRGVPCGLSAVDKMTKGAEPTHLIIVAGRPGMGKSAWAVGNCAVHGAVNLRIPTLILSLEMSRSELTERMLAGIARIDLARLREGNVTVGEWRDKLYPAAARLKDAPIEIDDRGGQTIAQLTAKIRRFRADERYFPRVALDPKGEPPRGQVIVDYIQLVRGSGEGDRTRDQVIGEITGGLKTVAKATNLPIIALSQLNRGLERREEKRPGLADLRESGNIEQDADVVLFIHRPWKYLSEEQRKDPVNEPLRTSAEIILGKHRHSPADLTATVKWLGPYACFATMETHPGYVQDPDRD